MKKSITFLALLLIATIAAAQEKEAPQETYNTTRDLESRIFTLTHRSPRMLLPTLNVLGSGFKNAIIRASEELGTITVRDFPENIVSIQAAIERLDRAPAPSPDVEMKISVLIASRKPLDSAAAAAVPEDLKSAVKQLQATLSYTHYGLMAATVHRTTIGSGIEGSGVAEPTLLGMTTAEGRPIFYTYGVRGITVPQQGDEAKVDVGNFAFTMRVPLNLGEGGVQYQEVGFNTPVSLRQGEKVVIGTTTMRDKALVVIVTAQIR